MSIAEGVPFRVLSSSLSGVPRPDTGGVELRPLAVAFTSAIPAAEALPSDRVERALARCVETALTVHGAFAPPPATFGAALARGVRAAEAALGWLDACPAADLWLAAACEAGDRHALAAFERLYGPEVRRAATRTRKGPIDPEDLVQLVWQKLLVGDRESGAKIRDYTGEGDLKSWVRVVAVRALVDATRKRSGAEAPASTERAAELLFAAGGDPELEYLKRHYRFEFAGAFSEALAGLVPEDRTALRQHLVDRLTVDQIAAAHGVHRATAARWVQRSREALLSDTRRRLMARLRLSRGELESVMRMIESQLHVSVIRMLG